jgi:hypothetical protein
MTFLLRKPLFPRRLRLLRKPQDLPALFDGASSGSEREDALAYLRFELIKHPASYATGKLDTLTQAKQAISSLVSTRWTSSVEARSGKCFAASGSSRGWWRRRSSCGARRTERPS